MRRTLGLCLIVSASLIPGRRLEAQLPVFVAGFAGGSFNTDDSGPAENGGGLAWQADLGLRLRQFAVGAEYAQHTTGNNRKVKIYGGVARLYSFGSGAVQGYLAAGVGSYRFGISGGDSRSTLGGSAGPGVTFRLGQSRVAFGLEARFHTTFDRLPGINTQEFIAVLGGLQLAF